MKKFLVCALVSLLAFTTMASAQNSKKSSNKKDAEITFNVDIDCKSCVNKLENALPYVKGVKDLKISLEKKTVWFKYDPAKVTKENLAKEIEKLGHKCSEAGAANAKACTDAKCHDCADHGHNHDKACGEKGHNHDKAKCGEKCNGCDGKTCGGKACGSAKCGEKK